jgi:hypothetical protein
MGCCLSEPVDFNAEVTLYHFDIHRAVGRGAFGKVIWLRIYVFFVFFFFDPALSGQGGGA